MVIKTVLAVIIWISLLYNTYGGELEECQRLAPLYNANVEVVLWDNTRVDLVNEEYAIEVDWANKWQQAIGQSVYYSIVTNKKPAIILLVNDLDQDLRHTLRCQLVCMKLDIKLYIEKIYTK